MMGKMYSLSNKEYIDTAISSYERRCDERYRFKLLNKNKNLEEKSKSKLRDDTNVSFRGKRNPNVSFRYIDIIKMESAVFHTG